VTEETTNISFYVAAILIMALVIFLSLFNYDVPPSASNSFITLIHLLAMG
jgi:hypothetical protein